MAKHWYSNRTQVFWTCMALAKGRTITHMDEIGEVKGWRPGANIHNLRRNYHWPIETEYKGPERIAHYRLPKRSDWRALDFPRSAKAVRDSLKTGKEVQNGATDAMGKSKRKLEGRYVPLPYAQLKSVAWRSLSGSAVRLWLELHTRYNGGKNGALTLSYTEAGDILRMGKATIQRAYDELVAKGFLALEREDNWYHRQAHEWRLTNKPMQTPKQKVLPTNDWRFWTPQKTERGSETEPSGLSVVPFENPRGRSGSKSEPVRAKTPRS